MKHKKYGIQLLGAVLLSFLIMLMRGLFRAGTGKSPGPAFFVGPASNKEVPKNGKGR